MDSELTSSSDNNVPIVLTMDILMKYKSVNKDIPTELRSFANNLNFKTRPKGFGWRKSEPRLKNNWLLNKKFTQDEEEKLYSQYRNILNKLSESNFNELAEEFKTLQIKREEHLSKLVETIFSKAILESKFSEVYAKLSKELSSYYIEDGDKKVLFRELLISKCQEMFNHAITLPPDKNAEESAFKFKEQVIGFITFLGELYNQDLLANKIIHSCFLLLLTKASNSRSYIIDSICTLMKTVYPKFSNCCPKEMEQLISKLEALKSSGISIKEKFAIMDVLDIVKN